MIYIICWCCAYCLKTSLSIMKLLVLIVFFLVQTLGCKVGEYKFLRHSDCTKFSTCLNGVLEELRCENGLHWSESKLSCLSPAFANCTDGADISNDPVINSDTECRVGQYLFLRHPECTKYQICVNGVLKVSNCSTGRHWSVTTSSCVNPGIANCQTETTVTEQPVRRRTYPATGCSHGEYRRHPECTKFLQCSHGVLYVHDCGPGLHWNVRAPGCDWPGSANCKPINNEEHPATTTTATTTVEATTTASTNNVKTTTTPSTTPVEAITATTTASTNNVKTTTTPSTTPVEATTARPKTTPATTPKKTPLNKKCIDGEYRRHDDCTKFRQCAHGRLITMNCPSILHWNEATNNCDWPFNAKCAPRTR